MKSHLTIEDLGQQLIRQRELKHDYIADTRKLTLLTSPETHRSDLHLEGVEDDLTLTDYAAGQVADRLRIPRKFWERLRADHPDLLDRNANELLRREPETRMVRALGSSARAFLSDRYRRLDNDELAEAVLPVLARIPDVYFPSTAITDERMWIKAVAPRVQAAVPGRVDDVVQAGVVIRNSEVGAGALTVQPMVYRLVCKNGMIAGKALRHYHLGRAVEGDETLNVLRDETRKADDRALMMKLADVVNASVDEAIFTDLVARMGETAATPPVADPPAAVRVLGKRLGLTETEEASVLRHLAIGGDLTQYGALNAVTRASQDVEDYERASEMEAMGGDVLAMTANEWAAVAR